MTLRHCFLISQSGVSRVLIGDFSWQVGRETGQIVPPPRVGAGGSLEGQPKAFPKHPVGVVAGAKVTILDILHKKTTIDQHLSLIHI